MRANQWIVAVALLGSVTAPSRAQGVGGQWIIDFNRRVQNMNGVISESDPARARMTLEVRGDSVTGTWVLISPVEVQMPAPRTLRGTIANGEVHLVSDPFVVRMREDGEEREMKLRTSYSFKLEAGELRGTQVSRPEGQDDGPPPRPFVAKRESP
ncbi:MAG: hypothetical protein U0163_06710 [Gemmatimonadaceae bacterium]